MNVQTSISSTKLHLLLILVFVTSFVFFTYTFLHEAGHALIGLLFGQTLREFDVSFWDFSAHVGMVGGSLTRAQQATQDVAGALLPLVIWILFVCLVPRRANFVLETLKWISSMAVINTLLAWIILPVLFLLDKAPPDDVTNFLQNSGMWPGTLMFVALTLYIGCWLFFLSKTDGLRNTFLLFRNSGFTTPPQGMRPLLSIMAGLLAVCIIFSFVLNLAAAGNPTDQFFPPQGFVLITQVNLAARPYSAETLAEFSLDEPAYAGVFIGLSHIKTSYVDLRVTGPNGYRSILLHGESYSAQQDSDLWEKILPPGTYQIVLTSHQSPGTASVYLKTP